MNRLSKGFAFRQDAAVVVEARKRAGAPANARSVCWGILLGVFGAGLSSPLAAQEPSGVASDVVAAEVPRESEPEDTNDTTVEEDALEGDEVPVEDDGHVLDQPVSGAGEGIGSYELQLSPDLALASPVLPEAPTVSEFHDLEVALRLPAYDFDAVSFLGASRSLITAVLETYCAAGLLFPREDGYHTVDVVLGVGCVLGATTLYIMGIRRLLYPTEAARAEARLHRFEAAMAAGTLDEESASVFAGELHAAARRDRRRRIFEVVFGALNLVATATLAGLTARGRISTVTGTSIATGTGALGVLGMASIWARSPSERAWARYQALR